MAKVAVIERNNKRKRLVKLFATKRMKLKEQIYKKDLSIEQRMKLVFKLAAIPRNSVKNRIRNRCSITGRGRGYYRKFNLSRNKLRELASYGLLPGVIKSSW